MCCYIHLDPLGVIVSGFNAYMHPFHYRFWNIFGEKEIDAVWKPNEDFCHIIVDSGMFNHHLPDSVLNAINNLNDQHITGKHKASETSSSISTDPISIQPQSTTIGLHKKIIADVTHIDPQSEECHINTTQPNNGVVLGSSQQIQVPSNGHNTLVTDNQCTETFI